MTRTLTEAEASKCRQRVGEIDLSLAALRQDRAALDKRIATLTHQAAQAIQELVESGHGPDLDRDAETVLRYCRIGHAGVHALRQWVRQMHPHLCVTQVGQDDPEDHRAYPTVGVYLLGQWSGSPDLALPLRRALAAVRLGRDHSSVTVLDEEFEDKSLRPTFQVVIREVNPTRDIYEALRVDPDERGRRTERTLCRGSMAHVIDCLRGHVSADPGHRR